MNRGILQSSLVQQIMMAAENPNWWNINNSSSPNILFPHSSWNDGQADHLPESWSQLLLGGLVSEDEKGCMSQFPAKKLEDWEEEILKKDQSAHATYMYGHGGSGVGVGVGSGSGVEDYNQQLPQKQSWSQMIPASSPQSCVTSFSSNMLDFSNNSPVDTRPRHPQLPDRSSSECNSNATNGGAVKKARIQSSTSQTAFKVRKEKLGDRITALHQLVSPFGKKFQPMPLRLESQSEIDGIQTDTASVLLEAIGYIRFLQSQIEALSLPYLGNGSASTRHQHSVQGERNCLFPEDPGQLLNENCLKRKGVSEQDCNEEPKKDLRSRGLCLVPVSCTLQVGSDNGADYWAPAFGGGFR